MAKFDYGARTKEGVFQAGTVEAAGYDTAINVLQRHGLIITSLRSQEETSFFKRDIALFQNVKNKDLVIFSRQISTLFEAQVPVVEAFTALIKQTEKAVFRKVLDDILNNVESGMSLSKAFGRHPKVFSNFYINMIKSGEASGKLQVVFNFLAEHTEREYYLAAKIKGAMAYPAFIVAAFIIVAILMMIVVVPQLTAILEETGQELPWVTKLLIASSRFIRQWIVFLAPTFIVLVVALWRYVKTPEGGEIKDKILLKLPIIGELLKKVYLARFAENLSTLIKGGLPIIQSLQVTGDVVGNSVYKYIIKNTINEIKGGGNISDVLSNYPESFPRFVSQMVATGERTGKLAQILESVSKFYQREVQNMTDNLTQLIEPVLLVILGAGVGLLLVSILMPIYNIAGSM